jgi:hypothetical protein
MKKLTPILFAFALALVAYPVIAATVVVKPGDTLSQIAKDNQTTVDALVEINGIPNADLIYPGQVFEIQNPSEDQLLGVSLPTIIADYEDNLATRITETTTSTFTLLRGTDDQDRTLNGFYGFVIDREYFTANCVGTACSIVARGIDVTDGETQVSDLMVEHRRGAVVKITNHPQLALISRILTGQESASSTFMFGNGTGTGDKCLKADNGTANLPKICYDDVIDRWKIYDDGLNSVVISTSSAVVLTASTTKAIGITNSQIYFVASSTGGLSFDAAGAAFFNGVVATSTIFNGANNVFNGITTHNGATYVTTPSVGSTSGLAVNDIALLQSVSMSIATGTAQVAITAGQALWVSSTSSQIMVENSEIPTSTYRFIGFATANASAGATVVYTKPGGINCQQSGLTAGNHYYLNGTAGQINTTPGSFFARVGIATSATCIQVMSPKYMVNGSFGIHSAVSGTSTTQFIGFYPAHIEVRTGCGTAGTPQTSQGFSIGDESNNSVSWGYDNTNYRGGTITGNAAYVYCGNTSFLIGTISARDKNGFTYTEGNSAAGTTGIVQYTAWSE